MLYAHQVVYTPVTQKTFTSNHRPVVVYVDQIYVTCNRKTALFRANDVGWVSRADTDALGNDKYGTFLDAKINNTAINDRLVGVFTTPETVVFHYNNIDLCISYGDMARLTVRAAKRSMHFRTTTQWSSVLSSLASRQKKDPSIVSDTEGKYYTLYDDDVSIEFPTIAHPDRICHGNVFHVETAVPGAWSVHLVGWVFKGTGTFYAPVARPSPDISIEPLCVSLLAHPYTRPVWIARAWAWITQTLSRVGFSPSRAKTAFVDPESSHVSDDSVTSTKIWVHGDHCNERIHIS